MVVLVRATMFCLLCATHAHCSSHHNIENSHITNGLKASYDNGRENNGQVSTDSNKQLPSRTRRESDEDDFIKLAFKVFGDGEKLSQEGFKNLLSVVGLKLSSGNSTFLKIKKDIKGDDNKTANNTKIAADYSKEQCESLDGILGGDSRDISMSEYESLCPWILYHVIPSDVRGATPCEENEEHVDIVQESHSVLVVWIYATVSVILISLCGLLAVAVIPLMQRTIYHSLLQFLVALAVGTLCGDALLHLLPHAMLNSHGAHDHSGSLGSSDTNHGEHELNLWKGFTASVAVVFFFFTEKCLSLLTEWRKRRQRKNKAKSTTRVRVMREETRSNEEDRVGEKLCKHKYSSYPYCYGEIANSTAENHTHGPNVDGEINSISHIREENGITKHDESDLQKEDAPCSEKQLLQSSGEALPEYTVILREHETRHHGHAHTHGHVHSAPGSLSSVVWMIVMGDGLHNFADGLAIGTAFGANLGGGVSTAVAVFCHELPHEIGDFAVLLKAGMSAKQAVFYNFLSSILCFVGMSLGVLLGHSETMQPWVFSFAAGMFLYIALVDMVPELSSSHSKEGSFCQCFAQFLGLMTGIGIMLLIALYEHDLMESFQHSF